MYSLHVKNHVLAFWLDQVGLTFMRHFLIGGVGSKILFEGENPLSRIWLDQPTLACGHRLLLEGVALEHCTLCVEIYHMGIRWDLKILSRGLSYMDDLQSFS